MCERELGGKTSLSHTPKMSDDVIQPCVRKLPSKCTMTAPLADQNVPKMLTIAGSDSGGYSRANRSGAGIQADLKTATALSVFATSAITCVTSQNTLLVDAIHPMPADFVKNQINAVLNDIGTSAIKTGLFLSHIKECCSVQKSYMPYARLSKNTIRLECLRSL